MTRVVDRYESLTSMMHRLGAQLWGTTYRVSKKDEHAALVLHQQLAGVPEAWAPRVGDDPRVRQVMRRDFLGSWLWAAKWVDGGCRMLEADEKYFAAMAQTKLAEDASGELRIPWPAFAVRIPRGLVVGSDGAEYTFATFGQFTDLARDGYEAPLGEQPNIPSDARRTDIAFYLIQSESGGGGLGPPGIWAYEPMSLADLLFRAPIDHDGEDNQLAPSVDLETESASDRRIRELVRRAAVGLLFTMQHTTNWKFGSTFNRAGQRIRSEPPPHRTIIIGKPLAIDVTQAVRDDARSGKHGAPSVQTLVRGHIKRQVIGVGRAGRKVVWIEPYWRGPENAPILARPYKVGNDHAKR